MFDDMIEKLLELTSDISLELRVVSEEDLPIV